MKNKIYFEQSTNESKQTVYAIHNLDKETAQAIASFIGSGIEKEKKPVDEILNSGALQEMPEIVTEEIQKWTKARITPLENLVEEMQQVLQ